MIDASIRPLILSRGSAQSGGRFELAARSSAFPDLMISIADEIRHQFKLTYQLPDGVKPNSRLSVAMTKVARTVRAPTRIDDR